MNAMRLVCSALQSKLKLVEMMFVANVGTSERREKLRSG